MIDISLGCSTVSEWTILIGLSTAHFTALQLLHIPSALLLTIMLAGIAVSTRDFSIPIPKSLSLLTQGLTGCPMAQNLQPILLGCVVHDRPRYLGCTNIVIG
jgi:uncharacterized membrane protein AbrB (regulator of aidB expression)